MNRYIIIIGAMKSGTSTLFSLLAQHPAIAPARIKEPGYFAFDDVNARGLDWYEDLFDFDANRHVYRLEASTDYTKSPFVTGVRARMTAHPDAEFKFIYIMRHPLRRIESHARHVAIRRKEIGQQISDTAKHGLENGVSLPSLAMTQYAAQLEYYAQDIAEGDVYLTTLEQLNEVPAAVLDDLARFLDLPPFEALDTTLQRNAVKDYKRLHPAWSALTKNRVVLTAGKLLMPAVLRQRIKAAFKYKPTIKGRFTLLSSEEAALLKLLDQDIRQIQDHGIEVARLWNLPLKP